MKSGQCWRNIIGQSMSRCSELWKISNACLFIQILLGIPLSLEIRMLFSWNKGRAHLTGRFYNLFSGKKGGERESQGDLPISAILSKSFIHLKYLICCLAYFEVSCPEPHHYPKNPNSTVWHQEACVFCPCQSFFQI